MPEFMPEEADDRVFPELYEEVSERVDRHQRATDAAATEPRPEPVAWFVEGVSTGGVPYRIATTVEEYARSARPQGEVVTPLYAGAAPEGHTHEWHYIHDRDGLRIFQCAHCRERQARNMAAPTEGWKDTTVKVEQPEPVPARDAGTGEITGWGVPPSATAPKQDPEVDNLVEQISGIAEQIFGWLEVRRDIVKPVSAELLAISNEVARLIDERNKAREWVRRWMDAVLNQYPEGMAFDPVSPHTMVANVVRGYEGATRHEGWTAKQWSKNAIYWMERCQQATRERDALKEYLEQRRKESKHDQSEIAALCAHRDALLDERDALKEEIDRRSAESREYNASVRSGIAALNARIDMMRQQVDELAAERDRAREAANRLTGYIGEKQSENVILKAERDALEARVESLQRGMEA